MTPSSLSPDELQRYHRHLILPNVGEDGQQRLKAARVLLVGAGGLGSPVALYLAAAGVGHLGIVDADVVDASNLQRQILHDASAIGVPKVDSAATRIAALNPAVGVTRYNTRLTRSNALEIIRDYDIVVDGSDNFPTRYLVNDACVILGKPNVYGSVLRFDGQASLFGAHDGPCYRCVFRDPPAPGTVPNCEEAGVFGVLPGIIGSIQATETIKYIIGIGDSLAGRLLVFDALCMRFEMVHVARDPACPACGTHEITKLIDYEDFCGLTPATASYAMSADYEEEYDDEITAQRLDARLRNGDKLVVLDVREPHEWAIARIPQARLVPLNSLPQAVHSIDRDSEIVAYCHHGGRSAAAVAWLQDQGFPRVKNLVGGIDRWSLDVDPAVRRY